ncbi:MAG: GDSL-type esterase/lipase family protein [Saprospiraceae bacterium]
MRNIFLAAIILTIFLSGCNQGLTEDIKINNPPPGLPKVKYLALGDSYTIGESVALENFPSQLTDSLNTNGFDLAFPVIRARTGWTTTDLLTSLNDNPLNVETFDFVTLLIGVNNQYRGLDTSLYVREFEELLLKSIEYADNISNRVWVLSIPDYAFTPFGMGNPDISKEIDLYNDINKRISITYNVNCKHN